MKKEIIIFDIDGVLVEAQGYHKALKDTVQMSAEKLGFNIQLEDEQIAKFEGLGISSEWHSGAACMAMLHLEGRLELSPLFALLANEQAQTPARLRLESAIEKLAKRLGKNPVSALAIIRQSESVESFSTALFQEMILGSEEFGRIYAQPPRLGVDSYLLNFDKPLLDANSKTALAAWMETSVRTCGIMTNRPSRQMPDAHYAQKLIGLTHIPVTGYGDLAWLAEKMGGETAEYSKPSPVHALTAVLRAKGKDANAALEEAYASTQGKTSEDLAALDDTRFWVLEDTPAGLISVDTMGKLLREAGLNVDVNKLGVTSSALKGEYLAARGAKVFANVNEALREILNR